MVITTIEKLGEILARVDLSGFTYCIHWGLKRYVVAFTDNKQWSLQLLTDQANHFAQHFDRINIGWRTSPTWTVLVDVGTSFDSFEEAMHIARMYSQDAIRDSKGFVEISVE